MLGNNKNSSQPMISHQGKAPIGPDLLQKTSQQHPSQNKGTNILNNGSGLSQSWLGGKIRSILSKGTNSQNIGNSADHFQHSTIDLLGYKSLTNDSNHFLLRSNAWDGDNGYAEILKIGGASINDLPQRLVNLILSRFIMFLRSCLLNMEFISIPIPNDCTPQYHIWNEQLDKINNKLIREQYTLNKHQHDQLVDRRSAILKTLKQFKEVDTELINRGFFLIIFGSTEPQLLKERNMVINFGESSLKLQVMSVNGKRELLKRLNNPNGVF